MKISDVDKAVKAIEDSLGDYHGQYGTDIIEGLRTALVIVKKVKEKLDGKPK